MEREDFNKQEKRLGTRVKFAIVLLGVYNLTKMIVASSVLVLCSGCDLESERILNVFLYCDLVVMSVTFAYFLYVFTSLVRQTYLR